MPPRIAFAGFNLESVSSVPQQVELAEFQRVCTRGAEIPVRFRGSNTVPGGCIAICEAEGAEFVPLFHTLLGALGPASDKAVAHYTRELLDSVAKAGRPDGIVLFLHGACWADSYVDVERHFIDALRAAQPDLPIAVALDDHVISLGINPKIPPVQLTDAEFDTHIRRTTGNRAKASEMEHAIRSHIRKHLETDPVLFKKMSERLKQILDGLGQQWDQIVKQLQALIDELRSDHQSVESAASDIPEVYLPFLRTVLEACSTGQEVDTRQLQVIHQMTMDVVDRVVEEVCTNRSIWSSFKLADQESLRSEVFEIIFDARLDGFNVADAELLADQLMQQAKANDDKLRRA